MEKILFKSTILCTMAFVCTATKTANMDFEIKAIETRNAPQAIGPYSQAILVKNGSQMLEISGQLPMTSTGELLTEPTEATKQCMQNLAAILQEAGMDFSNVTATTIFLTNMADFPAVNKAYESFLQKPYPARATVQVAALPKGAIVEIQMRAAK